MCGIAGVIALTDKGRQQLPKLQQSIRTLYSRGPDDEGIYTGETVGLAQRRLSIIDTSKAANQPMWDKTGRYVIIYNGEIFNHLELKQQHFSPAEQNAFKTHSDTEILLELFVKKGLECLYLIEGFYAWAVYDTKEDIVYIARDRFGKKPLLVYQDEDTIIFGSELKALFSFGIPKQLNYDALKLYLQFAYIPQPHSILHHVKKLGPGCYLKIQNGIAEEKKWYCMPEMQEYSGAPAYGEAQKKLVQLLEVAVKERLISDVPLGAFLSGGIDSSVIVALASRHVDKLNTFSIGYKDERFYDETYYAEIIAKKFKTNHVTLKLGVQDYLDHVLDVLDYLDEPFADTSAIPQYILCHETRKHVTVAVSGDGGDEIFAGYNKHYAEWQARRDSLKSKLVKTGYPLWKILPKDRNTKLTNLFRQLERFAEGASLSAKERYWYWASTFTEKEVDDLLQDTVLQKANEPAITAIKDENLRFISETDFNSVLRTDLELVLAGDMLVKVDLMSMANSVEVRSPFLDLQVIEYAFSLPAHYKIDGKRRKKIVKDAFQDLLPPEIYQRGKQGFEIPMLKWFREELHSYIFNDLLNDSFVKEQGIFNYNSIQNLKKQLYSNVSGNITDQLWVLVVFQHWYKKYFM
jgi:asparagine synthase (glutamine-hydrolysing)